MEQLEPELLLYHKNKGGTNKMSEIEYNYTRPAVPEKQYSKGWMNRLQIEAPSPSEPVECRAFVMAMGDDGETVKESMRNITIPDVFKEAETDPRIAQAMDLIFQVVTDKLAEQ